MRILVVEDDENSRVLQQTVLEAAGYQVVTAGNGKEALAAIHGAPPDLIVSDIMMPEMDGYVLCRMVKSDPALMRIPFIFYTATYTSEADQQLAAEIGATRFLIKPLEPEDFVRHVQETLAEGVRSRVALPLVRPDQRAVDTKYAGAVARKLDKKIEELKEARTRLKSSEDRLLRMEETYRMAQQIALAGCWDWDLRTGEFWCSDELGSLLGVDPAQLAGDHRNLLGRIAPEDRDRYARALALASEKGVAFSMEHSALGREDSVRRMHSRAEIVAMDPKTGKPARLVCAMRDITEQRKLEEERARMEMSLRQAQKMKALGALASGIAHDFNNVLTGISGSAELLGLREPPPSPEDREHINRILEASHRATDLVRQILNFSRRDEKAKCPTDLASVVDEALKFLRVAIPATIQIRADVRPDCPAVLADATQIYQVIINLCVNAQHAMLPNAGTLAIVLRGLRVQGWDESVRWGVRPGQYALLEVSDTGCGMDEATQERMFEPYFTTRKEGSGTGLGLSVVQGIVLGHNGHIGVASEVGKGTTISVCLPALSRTVEAAVHPSEGVLRGKGEHILLVDDEPLMTTVLVTMLKELNFKVTECNESDKAWELFRKDPSRFDLVITDLTMPGVDGATLARDMSRLRPDVPLILCTGLSELVEQRLASENGIRVVLRKPFMLKDLAAAVGKALQGKRKS